MPPQPPPRLNAPPPARQRPPAPSPALPQPPTATPVESLPKPSDLTFSKIIAGAGAAATTAVAGSFLGPTETVMGAALGSVVSAVASTLYERSLDRTRDTVKARVKLPAGRTVDVADTVEIPALCVPGGRETGPARVSVTPTDRATTVLPSAAPLPPPRRRRRWVALTLLTAGLFLVGLLTVTGVELLKGSTLRGETGTSVGRVVAAPPASSETTDPDPAEATEPAETPETSETSETSTDESSDEATESESATDEPDSDSEIRSGATDSSEEDSAGDESDGDADAPVLPLPTQGDPTSEP